MRAKGLLKKTERVGAAPKDAVQVVLWCGCGVAEVLLRMVDAKM
jgi:hypothetical protein